eukprot:COSAG05_NODE_2474_length_3022_cov_2.143885_4_plen_76_part_00
MPIVWMIIVCDVLRYELGDISVHTTAVFHGAGPNTLTQTRMIVGSTYVLPPAAASWSSWSSFSSSSWSSFSSSSS